MKSFWVKGEKVKVSDAFVEGSMSIADKVSIGKVGGKKRFLFFCLSCRRVRTGAMVDHGFLQCDHCGFTPRW